MGYYVWVCPWQTVRVRVRARDLERVDQQLP